MRILMSSLLSFVVAVTGAQPGEQQQIGHADWEYIFSHMPEVKKIEAELRTFETQLQNQLKQKSMELEAKYKSYQGIPGNTPDAIRKDKESELVYLQNNIQKFKQDAQESIQKKQAELMAPLFQKVGKAIEEIAVENGYAYIINPQVLGGGDVLLYSDERYNVSDLVLKKLGINAER